MSVRWLLGRHYPPLQGINLTNSLCINPFPLLSFGLKQKLEKWHDANFAKVIYLAGKNNISIEQKRDLGVIHIMTNISAKPLVYYCPRGADMLIATFGSRLEALPKIEKFYILMVVGAMGSHNVDPNFALHDYDAGTACEDHAIFLDWEEELPVDIKAVLDGMTGEMMLGLAEFLAIDLRTTFPS